MGAVTPVTVSVASREDVTARALAAFRGEAQGARISFASVDLLWRTLTKERWGLLQAMTGSGPVTLPEVARRVGRDPESVRTDLDALAQAGLLDRDGERFILPFDEVRVDFVLTKAA